MATRSVRSHERDLQLVPISVGACSMSLPWLQSAGGQVLSALDRMRGVISQMPAGPSLLMNQASYQGRAQTPLPCASPIVMMIMATIRSSVVVGCVSPYPARCTDCQSQDVVI